MTARLGIPADEHGIIRVFAVNLPPAQVEAMLQDSPPAAPGARPEVPAAATLLGWPALDTGHTELFALRDLTGFGLPGYLTEGLGLDEAQIAPDRARLAALDGYVLIVLSRAFRGQAVTLDIPAALTLIGSYREPSDPIRFDPLPTGGAEEVQNPKARKPVSDAAMSGRIAMAALAVLFALTALMVWMAG